ncbi:hypothetical protein PBAL39_01397 [Pedobacter sp. BAL39]|uniref:TolC family protein n=1 Tax=Pedobacter sp. BAL39 TaxID=391596 RepID=UPI00015594B6|nr:TolC family protein [Pedobacter sp. BAL39]EDM38228.1 hypothetical protein PBAL39_01397 [Pedobacter sp. BAL39]
MKKITTLTCLLITFLSFAASAQETILTDLNPTLLDKYISMAKEYYPKRKVSVAQEESAKIAIPMAKLSYLDIFTASYFYRPDQNDAINIENPYSVNGFQFGVNVNLGTLLTRPYVVKKAKADYKVAQLQTQDFDMFLATEVKRRYYAYVQTQSQLKISTQTAQENKNISETAKYRFEKGEATLDAYNATRILLANSNTSKIQAEVNFLIAKDSLEEIIGAKLSDVK